MTLALLDPDAEPLVVARVPEGAATREHPLRDLLHDLPGLLPVHEIEPEIGRVAAVAKELHLPGSGTLDLLLVGEHGRLVVVECKLWRNPQARREVVGQILDYASALRGYAYEDLQSAVSARLGRPGDVLYELARAAGSQMSEAAFVDRVSRDLAAGRFLLLVVGDGITEGAQRLGEFLRTQPGLSFEFGLVEMAEYRFHDPLLGAERRIVQPRVLARTAVIERHVIRSELPGAQVAPVAVAADAAPRTRMSGPANSGAAAGADAGARAAWRAFVDRFAAETRFNHPGQASATLGGMNWMRLPLPGPAHVTLYRSQPGQKVGAFLRYRSADGLMLFDALAEREGEIAAEFQDAGLPAPVWTRSDTEAAVTVTASSPAPWDDAREAEQRLWLGRAANRFVDSLRPRLGRLEA